MWMKKNNIIRQCNPSLPRSWKSDVLLYGGTFGPWFFGIIWHRKRPEHTGLESENIIFLISKTFAFCVRVLRFFIIITLFLSYSNCNHKSKLIYNYAIINFCCFILSLKMTGQIIFWFEKSLYSSVQEFFIHSIGNVALQISANSVHQHQKSKSFPSLKIFFRIEMIFCRWEIFPRIWV